MIEAPLPHRRLSLARAEGSITSRPSGGAGISVSKLDGRDIEMMPSIVTSPDQDTFRWDLDSQLLARHMRSRRIRRPVMID